MGSVRQGLIYVFDDTGMNIQNTVSACEIWRELREKTVTEINRVEITLLIFASIIFLAEV